MTLTEYNQPRPSLLVNLGGGWREDMTLSNAPIANAKTPGPAVILIRSEADDTISTDASRKLSATLQTNGYAIDNIAIPGLRRDLGADHALIIRAVGEQIKARLTPRLPQPEFASPKTIPFLACEIPAFLWLGFWLLRWKRSQPAQPKIPLTKWDIALRVVAVIMASWALAETAIHLLPPRMKVSDTTLSIARRKIVPPKWRDDFETLARQPIWQGQQLEILLTHVELSHYCVYELINWKLPPDLYRDFVLSPVIPGSETELNWRRSLWEFYYPRIRKENTTEAAATIVARTLRERVTIWPGYDKPQGIETIWRDQITSEQGFELIYTATLRAVGVPARLNPEHKTEYWDGAQWRPAPRPLIEAGLLPKKSSKS